MPRYLGSPTKYRGHVLLDTNNIRLVVDAEQLTLTEHRKLMILLCHREDDRNCKYQIYLDYNTDLPPWLTDTSPTDPLPTSSWQSRKN